MEFEILNNQSPKEYYNDILKMLYLCDGEFVPPLSSRNSTTQSDFSETSDRKDGIEKYFMNLKSQSTMVALENGNVTGFVSFKKNYTCNQISEKFLPNIYISTLLVSPDHRGKNLTRIMYNYLFDQYKDHFITTRTWSTNSAHIKILSDFDFRLIETLKNDRGEGIDTVYFIKEKRI